MQTNHIYIRYCKKLVAQQPLWDEGEQIKTRQDAEMGVYSARPPVLYLLSLILAIFHQYTNADVYLHVPRGSNNRLSGDKANRRNNDRVFDSQVSFFM